MKQSILKISTITISITIFICSLFFEAFSYEYQGVKIMSSIEAFLMGSIAVFGGGDFEWLVWLANPLCLTAIFCLIFDKKIAVKFALASILFALFFYSSNTILAAESGTRGKILHIKSGYYLWLSSIIILTIGSYFYFKNYIELKYED